MKRFFNFLLFLPIQFSIAHTCDSYYWFKQGTVVETTLYDKKGKPDGKTSCQIVAVESSGEGKTTSFLNTFYSESGKKQNEAKGSVRCNKGKIQFDLKNFVGED